ncbi:hypothetical protein D7X33_28240 [Butyricicoccus sp. 1XD8-22]|nr:hypothetical protein D7X33_28240 [Butyricicoccus sp. 1XD8-22]
MEKFEVNDYIIITDITKVIALEYLKFKQNYPYRIVGKTIDNTAMIENGKKNFIFTPLEMKYTRLATKEEVKRAYTKYYVDDFIRVHSKEKMYIGYDLHITNGDIYKVTNVDRFGLPTIIDDDGCPLGFIKEDLVFLEKVNDYETQNKDYLENLLEGFSIGDRISIFDISKIQNALGSGFYHNTPYEIVNILLDSKLIIIKNVSGQELAISGEELKYIRPFIDENDLKELENFIKELETKCIKNNINTMIDIALEERRFERVKEIVDMGIKY